MVWGQRTAEELITVWTRKQTPVLPSIREIGESNLNSASKTKSFYFDTK